ncbi:MAG TPA: response regulator, partial [Bellilinea sp.]|nr:response regulator [Bellilinea sp.]
MQVTVLVVDDEDNARNNIIEYLTPMGYEAVGAATLKEAREKLEHGIGDVILLDVSLPDGYGPSLLEETRNNPNRAPIIIITAHGDIDMAVECMKNGAHDFLTKPIQLDQMESSIRRAYEVVRMRRELAHYKQNEKKSLKFVIGQSDKFKRVL